MKRIIIIITLLMPILGFSQFYDIQNDNYIGTYLTTFDFLDSSNEFQTALLEININTKTFLSGRIHLRGFYTVKDANSGMVIKRGGIGVNPIQSIDELNLRFFLLEIGCDEEWHTFFEFNNDFTELSWGEFERQEPEGARAISPSTPDPCYELFLPENLTLTRQ